MKYLILLQSMYMNASMIKRFSLLSFRIVSHRVVYFSFATQRNGAQIVLYAVSDDIGLFSRNFLSIICIYIYVCVCVLYLYSLEILTVAKGNMPPDLKIY